MTDRDLQYLKRATPAELMKFTNGIPFSLCAWIKVALTDLKALTPELQDKAAKVEHAKWIAAGAVPNDPAESMRWAKEGSEQCVECGQPRHEPKNRFTFTRERGFGFHRLCGSCAQDFDYHHDPRAWAEAASELAARWQGRCLTRREIAQ
jgi:hypothetical protein